MLRWFATPLTHGTRAARSRWAVGRSTQTKEISENEILKACHGDSRCPWPLRQRSFSARTRFWRSRRGVEKSNPRPQPIRLTRRPAIRVRARRSRPTLRSRKTCTVRAAPPLVKPAASPCRRLRHHNSRSATSRTPAGVPAGVFLNGCHLGVPLSVCVGGRRFADGLQRARRAFNSQRRVTWRGAIWRRSES